MKLFIGPIHSDFQVEFTSIYSILLMLIIVLCTQTIRVLEQWSMIKN